MKIYSWNVNGVRAVLKKGALQEFLAQYKPDILCLQETKAKQEQKEVDFPEYIELWNAAQRPGYSGTAIFTKEKPLSTFSDFTEDLAIGYEWGEDQYGDPLNEGRIITAEYPEFYLVNVYTPNAKRDLSRLTLRHDLWDPAFFEFLLELEKHKPVVVCGDFNVAHREIDLARPGDNHHNAGFTDEERAGAERLAEHFVDTFRELHPEEQRYSWWSHWARARERNVGWRIDYFWISRELLPRLRAAEIHENVMGSDHCPVSIELEI